MSNKTSSQIKQYGSWFLALALGGLAAVAVNWQPANSDASDTSVQLAKAQGEGGAASLIAPLQQSPPAGLGATELAKLTAVIDQQNSSLVTLRNEMKLLQVRIEQLEQGNANTSRAIPATASATTSTPTIANLTALGEESSVAEAVLGRVDELALERLNLRHQAQLEGADRQGIREALRALPNDRQALREEFGDASYDRYLYASGRPNRLEVTSVLRGSVAASAGLQAGDVIQSIDGQSIFTLGDLQRIVRDPASGSVPIEVSRGTERIESSVTRGPLGVRTLGTSIDPSAP